jgi:hypothetical protein
MYYKRNVSCEIRTEYLYIIYTNVMFQMIDYVRSGTGLTTDEPTFDNFIVVS